MKKLNKEDFNIEFLSELELETTTAGDDGDAEAQAYSQKCAPSARCVSITVSLVSFTSTTKCSNATNTYTELSCC